jgi:hypothetical protein
MNTPRPSDVLFLRSLILTVGCFGAVSSVNAAPVVSNLTAAQQAATTLVDISYDLVASEFESVAVTLEASKIPKFLQKPRSGKDFSTGC